MGDLAPVDFSADLRTRGCAVCNHLSAHANDFFSKFQYALAADESARREFAIRRDLCSRHFWQLEAVSSPTGICLGVSPLVRLLAGELGRTAENFPNRSGIVTPANDSGQCRVCNLLREAEAHYLGGLATFVGAAAGHQSYAASCGLCLRHLAGLVALMTDDETIEFLVIHASRCLEKTAEDMKSYSEKTQALRRDLLTEDEHDAHVRALTHIAGRRNLCGAGKTAGWI